MIGRLARAAGREAVALGSSVKQPWALASLATLLYWLALNALRPLVALRLHQLGAEDGQIAVISAVYPLFSLVLAIPGGRLVDRVGLRRVLAVSMACMAVVGVGYGLARTPLQIFLLQVPNGIVELGAWLSLQALATHAGRGSFLARQLALFSLAWGIGVAVGPVVGAFVFHAAGFQVVGWIYAGAAVVAAVAALLSPYRGREVADERSGSEEGTLANVRRLVARPVVRSVLLSSFVALYVVSLNITFYPLFLERRGIPIPQIGILLTLMGTASLLVRIPLMAIRRRWGPDRVLLLGMWLSALGVALVPILGAFWALALVAVVVGAGYGVNPPITVELMARHTQPAERGLAMGLRVTANRLAQVVQPIVFGGVASFLTMAWAFPVSGAVLAAVTAWAARDVGRGAEERKQALA